MKKLLLTAACLFTLTTSTQAKFTYLNVYTIPIWVEAPIQFTKVSLFWETLAYYGLTKVTAAMAEPLDKYDAGIFDSTRSASATISWPDGDYETRDIDSEQFYDFDPFTRIARWWEKDTFTVIHRDGTRTATITYSAVMPQTVEFNQEDVHYKRSVLAGSHASDFSFDSFQFLKGYCIRRGSGAWGRPVTAWFKGWNYVPLWKNDILYHSPTTPWEDGHHCFIGPSTLGTSSLAVFKLAFGSPNAEVSSIGVVTLWFTPQP